MTTLEIVETVGSKAEAVFNFYHLSINTWTAPITNEDAVVPGPLDRALFIPHRPRMVSDSELLDLGLSEPGERLTSLDQVWGEVDKDD